MTLYTGEVSRHHDESHANEVLDVGDGIETQFTGRSEQFPVKFGTVLVEFTNGAGTFQVLDSSGTFTHPQLNSGSIDEDGNYDFDFISALTDTTELKIVSYDTKGFLTKLLELISKKPTKDVIGTGNGVQVIFTQTLTGSGAIEPGNVRLRWIRDGVEYDIWDNSQNGFDHENINSSNINYTTRQVTVEYILAPDDTTPVDVWSVEAGEHWVQVLEERTITDDEGNIETTPDNQKEVVLYSSGISGQEEIIVGLREYSRTLDGVFGLEVALGKRWTYQDDINGYFWHDTTHEVFPYHNTTSHYNTTYKASTQSQKFVYSNDVMQYWVNITKSRVIMVIRNAGTIYTHSYFGDCLRISSPSKYPKCQVVTGNTISFIPYTNTSIFGLGRPGANCWRFFDELGEYKLATSGSVTFGEITTTYNKFKNTGILKRTTTNKNFVQRIACFNRGDSGTRQTTGRFYFMLDGVFICPDNEIDSEHTVNVTEYIAFQDVFRTTYQDYICITQQ